MMGVTGLALLWLATVPCEARERDARQLEEVVDQRPAELDALLDALELRWGGMPLRAKRDASPAERVEVAKRRMGRACDELEASKGEAPPPPSDKARLEEILSRPEFAEARQRQGDAFKRLVHAVLDWLGELLQTRGAQSFATTTRTVVLVLGFAVVLFAALRLRHWRRGPARRGGAKAGSEATARVLDSPGEHLARARAALSGQPREAIREGLLALLSSLEMRRLARPDRVKTNRELVGELPGRGASAQLTREVERLVRWYDQAFYSLEPVPEQAAARFVAEVERLHRTQEGAAA
jgi:hypothetical protein